MELKKLLDRLENKIGEVHPELKTRAIKLVEKAYAKGLFVGLTYGLRTKAEQDALYRKGRFENKGKEPIVTNAQGGYSYHNYGLAFDICLLNEKGDVAYWGGKDLNDNNKDDILEVGEIGRSLGLEWGGDWKGFVDRPHFQLTFGLDIKELLAGKKPPAKLDVKKSDKDVLKKPVKPSEKKDENGRIGLVEVIVPLLNVRKEPSLQGDIARKLKQGNRFYVYEHKKTDIDWYCISAGQWITAEPKYVKFTKI